MPPVNDHTAQRHDVAEGARRRIALITSSFAPHIGGVETHVAHLAEELSARGHAVEVWAADRGMRSARHFPVEVRYLRTPLPARTLDGVYRALWLVPRAWRDWRRAHASFRPELLAVQCFGPNGVYASALHRSCRTPLVVTSHGETLGDDNGAYRSALLRRELRRAIADASAVSAPSAYVLEDLRARFGLAEGAGEIVSNGVDLSTGTSSPDVPRPRLVLAVGRLGRMKGFDLLIDAFAAADLRDARLEIIGGGTERAALERQIAEAGLSDRVRLVGERRPDEVARRIGEAAVVAVPSRSESFGIIALEAWRGGAALVMTSRGGASEFVRDGEDGLLVDPEDRDALAGSLRLLLTDEHRRLHLARGGASRVSEFTWQAVTDRYEALFARVAAAAGATAA